MSLDEVIENALRSSIWKVAPVDAQPSITLTRWSIRHTNDGDYFVGFHNGAGRVSTKVVTFDDETKKGVTESGRVYQLSGEPGISGDAEHTWGMYKQINGLTEL